ncbi:MAG: nucleotide exchange factor GrpE [Actinobacteria bacterium]|nr:nucleotide exchange factor GrpE [Actinomycetota bacterium]
MEKKANKHESGNGDEITEELLKFKKKSMKKKNFPEDTDVEIDALKEEIELLRKELLHYKKLEEDYLDRIKRLHADYDNFRKRSAREQSDTVAKANKDLIEKMLPVIDSFEQALLMGQDLKGSDDDFLKGVKMIYEKLMDTLEKEGVGVIDPYGQEFNPHECEVAVTARAENEEEGTVLEVLRKGYKLNDFLIRPAVVKVCKNN